MGISDQHYFRNCVVFHHKLRESFEDFCKLCMKKLDNNKSYPGVSFYKNEGDCYAELYALDRTFRIFFHIENDGEYTLGVLKAILPSDQDVNDIVLHAVYFDPLGNTKSDLKAEYSMNQIHDSEFLRHFLNSLAKNYLEHMKSLGD